MADAVRQVDYFYVQVPHKAGEAAKALRTLKDAGVNLLATRSRAPKPDWPPSTSSI